MMTHRALQLLLGIRQVARVLSEQLGQLQARGRLVRRHQRLRQQGVERLDRLQRVPFVHELARQQAQAVGDGRRGHRWWGCVWCERGESGARGGREGGVSSVSLNAQAFGGVRPSGLGSARALLVMKKGELLRGGVGVCE
jgi:hypothetical protein